MNISQRIKLNPNDPNTDTYIKVKLEQNVDTLEFLTLNINTKDAYQDFNADYGVLVGRVTANNGLGIPNAKISIFIELEDSDAEDNNIVNIYPYKTPRDKNNDGKVYNLLPRVGKKDSITKVVSPKQPFGSFPIKEEIVTNPNYLKVYKKYYKYTAVSNNSGDYMIFGAPVGVQTVHMSVDITDIGKYSMNPASMVTNLGFSSNLFTDDNTKIKENSELGSLPNTDLQEISVNIIPFWGDSANFEIGITRQDFRIKADLINTFTIFGSSFTDGENSMWCDGGGGGAYIRELHFIRDPNNMDVNLGISSKRCGSITEKIYYFPDTVTDEFIADGISNYKDLSSYMKVLDSSEYTSYKKNGDFVFIVPCNRHRIYIDEYGKEVEVTNNENIGIYNQFRGFITFEYTNDNLPLDLTVELTSGDGSNIYYWYRGLRYKFKFPQMASGLGHSFKYDDDTIPPTKDTIMWKNTHKLFSGGTIYSIAQFVPVVANDYGYDDGYYDNSNKGFLRGDKINTLPTYTSDYYLNNRAIGIILTNNVNKDGGTGITTNNNSGYGLPGNIKIGNKQEFFGGNWLNFSLYFPQVGVYESGNLVWGTNNYSSGGYPYGLISSSHYTQEFYYVDNTGTTIGNAITHAFRYSFNGRDKNKQKIAANDENTFGFARSDLHYTDFIVVPTSDIEKIRNYVDTKGFTNNDLDDFGVMLTETNYKNGKNSNCPYLGGRKNLTGSTTNKDTNYYFYKGLGDSDCIKYLISLGLV